MGASDFYVDYETDVPNFSDEMKAEVERRLLDLAGDHTDLVGAAVSVSAVAKNDLPVIYRARVVVYARPEDIAASKQEDTVQAALKGALSAVERQVREKRDKLGEAWKREDLNNPPANPPV